MTTFYIVRHGETDYNKGGRFQGQMDTQLNAEGLAQSKRIGQRMANVHLDAIYCSDLSRARETALACAAGRPIILEPRLREINVGRVQGLMHSEVATREPEYWAAFNEDQDTVPFPDGESARQVQDRAMAALAEIQARYPNGHVGIFTHGGVIKCIAMAIMEIPLSKRAKTVIGNCSLTVVDWSDRGRRIRSLNDTGHLVQAPCDVKADF